MSDLISKAELFNRLATLRTQMHENEYKTKVYQIIQGMETIDIPRGWTPCTEKLPDTYGSYLCTWVGLIGQQPYVDVYYYGSPLLPMNGNEGVGWYESTEEGDFYRDVVAWMPLPQPYKER